MSDNTQHACFHCGQPVPQGSHYHVVIKGEERDMCCHGCQAVAQAIVDGGMESFYDHRDGPSRRPEDLIPEQLEKFDLYDQEKLQQNFVEIDDANVKTASLILEGITCAACVWLIEHTLNRLPGVVSARVNLSGKRLLLHWDNDHITLSEIIRKQGRIGYAATPFDP